ncbi:endonuclease III [Gottschalkia acidurici 9a]|uniref:Endonuclease III n=1 Tax=Gottschalkia acidurici (strain ATCC 7906 / DSM 604 / BCRC 14475 / CIP 104303 / KCTC 5404 / NCIMB 10678 / 9a) TaxID=1128398 RepID=K0B0B7_GOTA9|nr:endonuclease III [Gottschalkia acidurici]AFS78091.1 endonuclease III [Gottschalkia acidurici 9a]
MKTLKKQEIREVIDELEKLYPNAECELNFTTPFELLVATILSAQCTDKRVNIVTEKLFKDYNTPEDFLKLKEGELELLIKSTGFYRNKSKSILGTSRILVDKYNSQVPDTREELMKLPGVGRKTANVVMSNAFGKEAIAVDTHVFRVSNRIGLANSSNVDKTEEDLMKNIPENEWSKAHHLLIFHGRRICKARNPQCELCPLRGVCFYYKKTV